MQANYAAAVSVNTRQCGLLSAPLYHYDPDFPSTKTVMCKDHTVVVWCVKCHVGLRWDHQTHFHSFSKWWLQQRGKKLRCCSWINLRCLLDSFFLPASWPELGTSPAAPSPSNTYTRLFVSIKQAIHFSCFVSLLAAAPLHILLFLTPQMLSAL